MRRVLGGLALLVAAFGADVAQAGGVHWYVKGQFDDGASLSGWFDINQYGFLGTSHLKTTDGTAFTGMTYTTPGVSANNTATSISYFPNAYVDGMELDFAGDLNIAAATNPLLTSSYECRGNYCSPTTSNFRHIVSGYASINPIPTPEPASWLLTILGFGLTGAMMRGRRAPRAAIA